jgi:hypothetical protein
VRVGRAWAYFCGADYLWHRFLLAGFGWRGLACGNCHATPVTLVYLWLVPLKPQMMQWTPGLKIDRCANQNWRRVGVRLNRSFNDSSYHRAANSAANLPSPAVAVQPQRKLLQHTTSSRKSVCLVDRLSCPIRSPAAECSALAQNHILWLSG